MKKNLKIFIPIVTGFLLVLVIIVYSVITKKDIADLIVLGKIYTGKDEKIVNAMAIKNDKIMFVGSKEDITKYQGINSEILDYKGGLILSGFTDTHTHVTPSFSTKHYQIDISFGKTVEEYLNIIKEYIKNNPDKDMYIGRGWDYMLFDNGTPKKELLDEILPDKPIFLKSADGHSCWINSKMIEKIGVTNETPDPIGGKIVKDENESIVGTFKDAAMDTLVKPYLTPNTVEEYKKLILEAQDFYASMGYSSYVEVLVESDKTNLNIYKAYEELDKEGKLKLRVEGAWNLANDENYLENLKNIIKYYKKSKGGMFELTDIKIFMDGVAETKTAYFSESYNNDPENFGADRWPEDKDFNKLVEIVTLANKNNMKVHFHAIGDAAITKALDAIEESQKENENINVHNVITHLEVINEKDFSRFKKLNVVASANLSWGCKDDMVYPTVEVANLGEKRASSAYPYKTLLDSGAKISMATDYPAGSVVSPIAAYIVAVNRNSSDNPKNVRDETQKMTSYEALNVICYGGAYQMNQDDIRGTLEVGKKADFIVLNKNILDNVTTNLLDTEVLLNVVNGQKIYLKK